MLFWHQSPEVRRYADDVRRRIAIALHSMGEGIDPPYREPRFNRPEDADGFLQTRGGAEAGVDADEETRRRQRSSFDDFLRQDDGAEQGTYVFNTGADTRGMDEGLRRRGDGPRGFTPLYTNPFADEHHIDHDEINDEPEQTRQIAPAADEVSDIYSATTQDKDEKPTPAVLIDADPTPARSESASTATLEREIGVDEYMTAGQENRDEAYASIQAWAQNTSTDFYSPLPVTPTAPMSEPEIISDDGMLTPTDSVSLVGSGEDIANDAQSSRADENGRYYDVMSESSGMATPASWSEIGSVISESDAPVPVRR
ncbi:hypothetical protein NXS19_010032 [Fusarium pseudograminearum]|nr:hypothetical protein NXS19_010032 [Fusarium pseudograminearum]